MLEKRQVPAYQAIRRECEPMAKVYKVVNRNITGGWFKDAHERIETQIQPLLDEHAKAGRCIRLRPRRPRRASISCWFGRQTPTSPQYATARPALAVLAAALVNETEEALGSFGASFCVTTEVFTVEEMHDALALPWNSHPAEVEDQVKVRIQTSIPQSSQLLGLLGSTFRVLDIAERPTGRPGSRLSAMTCLIPLHLTPDSWHETAGKPTAFLLEVAVPASDRTEPVGRSGIQR
jgi:hypothetical protein